MSKKRQERLAMLLWANLHGVKRDIETRWSFFADQPEADPYRRAVAGALGNLARG